MAKKVRVNPNMLLLIAYYYTISFAPARRAQLPHGEKGDPKYALTNSI